MRNLISGCESRSSERSPAEWRHCPRKWLWCACRWRHGRTRPCFVVSETSDASRDSNQDRQAGSSGWMSDLLRADFKWQEGYAAFTVSLSLLDSVKRYIANQEQHHRKIDFATEWKLLLDNTALYFRCGDSFGVKNSQSSG